MSETHTPALGIVTDAVAPSFDEAFALTAAWGVRHYEVRMGAEGRFPFLTAAEEAHIEGEIRAGAHVTAVSPGLLKGHVGDTARLRCELDDVLPRAIDGALRFEAPVVILFGFERYDGEPDTNRLIVLRAFEQAAEAADAQGLVVAIENEPRFWIDRAADTVSLLRELDHPALRLNWDPANLHWGGRRPTYEDFCLLQPYLANVHLKDYTPDDPDVPWRPFGQGTTPWAEILPWLVAETDLTHFTLETHCEPLVPNSEAGLEAARTLLTDVTADLAAARR